MTRVLIMVIAGSRIATSHKHEEFVAKHLQLIYEAQGTDVVFRHGGQRGIDTIGATIATYYGWDVVKFEADEAKYGHAARAICTDEMLTGADFLLAFPGADSRGTMDAIKQAIEKRIQFKGVPL